MIDIILIAQEVSKSGIDWTGVALFVTALGGVITAILQAIGKKELASVAQEATAQSVVLIEGIEAADKSTADFTVLQKQLEEAGITVSEGQLEAVAHAATKHVKASIKATTLGTDLGKHLTDLVRTTTTLDPAELRKRLDADGAKEEKSSE